MSYKLTATAERELSAILDYVADYDGPHSGPYISGFIAICHPKRHE